MLVKGDGSSSISSAAGEDSKADRDMVTSCAATFPDVLGDTPDRTIRWPKMAWNWLAEGLLFQPPKTHTQTPHLHLLTYSYPGNMHT